jgi:hypothetical protein
VRQYGSIDGVVVRIGGRDQTVHLTLEIEGGEHITGCHTNRQTAKELAHCLFEPVRLFGRGRWARDNDGRWSLLDFKIESFDPLDGMPLSEAVERLRAIDAEWGPDALSDLQMIRHGTASNGGP